MSARGPRPNTGFISASLGPDAVTSSGHVKVLPTLQLPAHSNIFAMGDIIDWNEQKQFMKVTGGHAPIVANNVAAYLSGRTLKHYKGSPEIISVTVGKVSSSLGSNVQGLIFARRSYRMVASVIWGCYGESLWETGSPGCSSLEVS